MEQYTEKEKAILKQGKEGPFFTIVTELTKEEFDQFAEKLMKDDNTEMLITLPSIYWDYDRSKIIDYFIDRGVVEALLTFLDYCNDFSTANSNLNQTKIVDQLLEKGDKRFVKEILDSDYIYFLTDEKQKERLEKFIS